MSVPVGRFGETHIFVHVTFAVSALILAASGYFLHLVVFLGSLLFHEIGHIAAAAWMGAEVSRIEIWPFGATARLERSWQLTPPKEALAAFMGPFNSGLLFGLVSAVDRGFLETKGMGLLAEFPLLHLLMRINLGLFLVNLIPCLPLDGGRILRSRLSLKYGYLVASKKVISLGYYVGAGIGFLGLAGLLIGKAWISPLLLGPLILWGAFEERENLHAVNFMEVVSRADRLRKKKAIPVQETLVSGDTRVKEVVVRLRPSQYSVFLVCGSKMKVLGKVTETALLEAFFKGDVNRKMREFCQNLD